MSEVRFGYLALCFTAATQAERMPPGRRRDQALDAALFFLALAIGWRPTDRTSPIKAIEAARRRS